MIDLRERIEACLATGKVEIARELLGHPFSIRGTVIHGAKLGRKIGFPTANMELPDDVGLRPGVYAVWFRDGDGNTFRGVASFGRRPTVDIDGKLLLETFVFDFSGDLYGCDCEVLFASFLRSEEKFDDLEGLIEQIRSDELVAREFLESASPVGLLPLAPSAPFYSGAGLGSPR